MRSIGPRRQTDSIESRGEDEIMGKKKIRFKHPAAISAAQLRTSPSEAALMPSVLKVFFLGVSLLALLPGDSGVSQPVPNLPGSTRATILQLVQTQQDKTPSPPPTPSSTESKLVRPPWYPIAPPQGAQDAPIPGEHLPPRMACEEALHLAAAIQAYLKSKLHLTAAQREMWRNLELAAEPSLDEQRDLCAQLPSDETTVLDLSQRNALTDRMLSVRTEYLRRTQEPGRDLFLSLSPEQRAIIDASPFSKVEALH